MKRLLWFIGGFLAASAIFLVTIFFDTKKRESFGGFTLYETIEGDEEKLMVIDGIDMGVWVTAEKESLRVSWATDLAISDILFDAKYEKENGFTVTWIHPNEDGSQNEFTDTNADGIPETKRVKDSAGHLTGSHKIELTETKIN